MRTGVVVHLSPTDRKRLRSIVDGRNSLQKHVWRARIVLATADGVGTVEIMRTAGVSKTAVWRWQARFMDEGVEGLLRDKTRPPGTPRLPLDVAERVVALTLCDPPGETTHWTGRLMAKVAGVGLTSVQRIWKAHGLAPHRIRAFKLSNDPFFVEEVRDIVGLYLNPPDHAIVLAVDEKSQIQALSRTQPVLPMGLGYVEGVTHDYVRHGTTTLFAALDIATGTVFTDCKPRHRHQEFLAFLKRIDSAVPAHLDVHLVVDNYATHKHGKVRAWLAQRPRFQVHYTPTYSSSLNQVERWFGLITQQAIRRGSFRSVRELIRRIEEFVQHYNRHSRPFLWTATADSIFQKLTRICSRISGTPH